ncbi:uncharacterized protein [Dermacentor albipictus]|uniref:uncharacterized protein isoform X2 n=1 Tax=Dermacentor albipictus TaxID=60249 RepID=UPI0031FBC442
MAGTCHCVAMAGMVAQASIRGPPQRCCNRPRAKQADVPTPVMEAIVEGTGEAAGVRSTATPAEDPPRRASLTERVAAVPAPCSATTSTATATGGYLDDGVVAVRPQCGTG